MKSPIINAVWAIALIIVLGSCSKTETISLNQSDISQNELKELALTKGDTIAYHQLSIGYMDSPNDPNFYTVASTMANKYKYHEAYLDSYYTLTDYYHRSNYRNLDDLDISKRKSAISYLILGANKGSKECKKLLGHYYIDGKYIAQNMKEGKRLIQEGELY